MLSSRNEGEFCRGAGLSGITAYRAPYLPYAGSALKGGRYRKLENITLPLRFCVLTVHLVTMFAVALSLKMLVKQYDGLPSGSAQSKSHLHMMEAAVFTGLICFLIEFIALFAGVTLFRRAVTFWSTVFHAVGAIIIIYFYNQPIAPIDYLVVVIVFSVLPAAFEALFWLYLVTFSFKSY